MRGPNEGRFSAFQMSRSISGLTAIVTGAASGIGRACVETLAYAGANVLVTDLDETGAQRVAARLRQEGFAAESKILDIQDNHAIQTAVEYAVTHFGGLDIVVNNAGINRKVSPGAAGYDESWDLSLAVMLSGPKTLINASLVYLQASKCARIVNIASIEGLATTYGNGPYAVAKAGILGLTRAMAVDLGQYGITVNAICPGPILTGMTRDLAQPLQDRYLDRFTVLKRPGQPEEVAHMVLNLCLPSSGFVTGASVIVDGGMMARSS